MALPSAQASGMAGLIQLAFDDNPVLRSQMRQIGAAQADVKGAHWQFYPTPSVSVEQVNASAGDPSYSQRDSGVITFRLQQPLWTGGRLTAGLARAEASVALAQAQLEESRQQMALRVIAAWGEWKAGAERSRALSESVTTHEQLAARIERRVEQGLSAAADIVLAQGRLQQARAEAALAQAQQASALARLEQLTGQQLASERLQSLAVSPVEPLRELAPLLEKAWVHSPASARLQAQIRQQEMELQIRQAQRLPEVYVRAEHQQGSFSATGPSSAHRVFIGLSATPGAGLSAQSAVESAAARVEALLAERDAARRSLSEQITLDHVAALTQAQRRTSLRAGVQLTQDMSDSWGRQFQVGQKTWIEVLNAARELAQAKTLLAEADVAYVASTWRLAVLVDGVPAVLSGQLPAAGTHTR